MERVSNGEMKRKIHAYEYIRVSIYFYNIFFNKHHLYQCNGDKFEKFHIPSLGFDKFNINYIRMHTYVPSN